MKVATRDEMDAAIERVLTEAARLGMQKETAEKLISFAELVNRELFGPRPKPMLPDPDFDAPGPTPTIPLVRPRDETGPTDDAT